MKGKLIFLSILILLFGIFVFVRFFILEQQNVYGRLKIVSSPTSNVFINNLVIGKTPFDERYKAGEYILKLIPDKTATDTASWQGKVQVYKNALTYVNRELGSSDVTSAGEIFTTTRMERPPKSSNHGAISIETEPQGAIIYLDNDEKGVASLILEDVIKGDHELSVFMPGFFRRTQKINVDPGYQVNASFKLAIDQSSSLSEKTKAAKSKKGQETKESTESAKTGKTTLIIKDTPTGFLRVREEPSIEATEAAQVKPGDEFDFVEEDNGWYKIEYEKGKEGWVYSQYVEKKEE